MRSKSFIVLQIIMNFRALRCSTNCITGMPSASFVPTRTSTTTRTGTRLSIQSCDKGSRSYQSRPSSLVAGNLQCSNPKNLNTSSRSTSTNISTSTSKYYQLSGVGRGGSAKIETQSNKNGDTGSPGHGTNTGTDTGHTIHTDLPLSMGGTNKAPQPVEYLLAAYIGCTQATAMFVGRNMQPRLLIDRMEFEIEGERDERGALDCLPIRNGIGIGASTSTSTSIRSSSKVQSAQTQDEDAEDIQEFPSIPSRLLRIKGSIAVFTKNRKGEDVESIGESAMNLLEKHTETRCPVANMILSSGCIIDVEWLDGAAAAAAGR